MRRCFLAVSIVFSLVLLSVPMVNAGSDGHRARYVKLQKDSQDCEELNHYDVIRRQKTTLANQLLFLSFVKDDEYGFPASSVYFGHDVTEDFQVRYVYADDTAHTTEFPHLKVCLAGMDELYVNFLDGKAPDELRFYIHPGNPHQLTAETVKPVLLNDGKIELKPEHFKDNQGVLFAIAKDSGDLLYRKYVWVIVP